MKRFVLLDTTPIPENGGALCLFEYGEETPTRQVVRDIWAKIISSPSMNPLGIVDFKTTIQ